MDRNLFTVGYEGQSMESFISTLKAHYVECLLDVREIPLSRKRGFSKSALRDHLAENEIQYVHLRDLGSPKNVRNQLKASGNYKVFFKAMNKHLAEVTDTIEQAHSYVKQNTCCLMCFERFAETCHRSLVAKKIKEHDGNGLTVMNI